RHVHCAFVASSRIVALDWRYEMHIPVNIDSITRRAVITFSVAALASVLLAANAGPGRSAIAPPVVHSGVAATAFPHPHVIVTRGRGRVVSISADGGTVAIHSQPWRGNRLCDAATAWRPASGHVFQFGAPLCTPGDGNGANLVGLAFGGGH